MYHSVGIKIYIKDQDGNLRTSGPAFIQATSAMGMLSLSDGLVKALMLLENAGAIDSYAVVLKCETDQTAPGAGP
jgi:hypothetical protein